MSSALSNLTASEELVVTKVMYALSASSNTKDAAALSPNLTELVEPNVSAPSPPPDNVRSPAISTAPEKSPVAASSSPLTVKFLIPV